MTSHLLQRIGSLDRILFRLSALADPAENPGLTSSELKEALTPNVAMKRWSL
jgi:hypothetical protein